jgi:hypothetical protein
VTALHATVGALVIVLNLVAGGWGALAWARRRPSRAFWTLLRVAQVVVVAQVVLGFALIASGRQVADALHLLYGVAPLVVTLATEAMRAGATQRTLADVEDPLALPRSRQDELALAILRREMGIMSVGALLIVTLALRAYFIAGGT